jgi:hypothetical protein
LVRTIRDRRRAAEETRETVLNGQARGCEHTDAADYPRQCATEDRRLLLVAGDDERSGHRRVDVHLVAARGVPHVDHVDEPGVFEFLEVIPDVLDGRIDGLSDIAGCSRLLVEAGVYSAGGIGREGTEDLVRIFTL